MPKLTLVLERRALKVYEIDRPVIRIGRQPELDIVIDNVAVSRQQAEIRLQGMQWCVRDLDSRNGTLLNGRKLTGLEPLERGDEIAFGKFSLFFGHVPAEPAAGCGLASATPDPASLPTISRWSSSAVQRMSPCVRRGS